MKNKYGCEIPGSNEEENTQWGYSEGEIYGDGSY